MKILAFDTSNGSTSVAISHGQNVLAYIEDLDSSVQAERLIPMIEQALIIANLTYSEIDYLGVINGPGSFTGIRIGLAAAKAIILSTNIIGQALTNFEISFYRTQMQIKEYDKIIIFLNAYRDQLYVKVFNKDGTQNSKEPSLINVNNALDIVKSFEGKIICAGSGVAIIYEQIKLHPEITILPRFSRIKALHICKYLSLAIQNNLVLNPIEPLYIRQPDAKIKST